MSTGSNWESLFCLSLCWILSHNLEVGVAFVPGLRPDQTHLQELFRPCHKGSRKREKKGRFLGSDSRWQLEKSGFRAVCFWGPGDMPIWLVYNAEVRVNRSSNPTQFPSVCFWGFRTLSRQNVPPHPPKSLNTDVHNEAGIFIPKVSWNQDSAPWRRWAIVF